MPLEISRHEAAGSTKSRTVAPPIVQTASKVYHSEVASYRQKR